MTCKHRLQLQDERAQLVNYGISDPHYLSPVRSHLFGDRHDHIATLAFAVHQLEVAGVLAFAALFVGRKRLSPAAASGGRYLLRRSRPTATVGRYPRVNMQIIIGLMHGFESQFARLSLLIT
jgi:hypothetical protein